LRVPQLPDPARTRLIAMIKRADKVGQGVPVSVAAGILGITRPTVKVWMSRGVLERVADARPVAVTARSLGEAIAATSHIRAVGKDERLLRRVLDALEDQRTRIALGDRLEELESRVALDAARVAEELFS
jgi:hypothetical protein